MKKTNARKYAVAGLGEWGIAEGLVYENWEVKKRDLKELFEKDYRAFFGLDYGYVNDPTAFIAFLVNVKEKEIHIFDEFYKKRMLNCDIANEIKKRGYAKERIRADSAEPKSNEDLRRLGIHRITASAKGKDSILNGIARISEYKITVEPDCVAAIKELSSYCYSDRRNERGLRLPEDSENHLMDALRYAFEDVKYLEHQREDTLGFKGRELLFGRWAQ
jgi:phage terminase large subunit